MMYSAEVMRLHRRIEKAREEARRVKETGGDFLPLVRERKTAEAELEQAPNQPFNTPFRDAFAAIRQQH